MDAASLHAVAEPRRREILRLVWDGERAAGEIHRAIGEVTFGAVSQHLRVLSDAGLVEVRKHGRHRYYRARRTALGPLRRALEQMWASALDDLARLAEAEDQGDRR
jgi:DNA-binding transcriptional ArsR family regulator